MDARSPLLITLKIRRGIPRLRSGRFVRSFRRSLSECSSRTGFRVVHYSIQQDHVHLLVEADDNKCLANGMKSVGPRLARCVHRIFDRSGAVLAERFHSVVKRSPKEVRRALSYVLLNVRKHYRERYGKPPDVMLDEASSGRWVLGWAYAPPSGQTDSSIRPTAAAESWLLRSGWRRGGGLIDPAEVPSGGRQ